MKTQEQKKAEVLNYFHKTSQHLFVTEQGMMFKIIPFEKEGVLYYSKLIIGKDTMKIETHELFKWGVRWKSNYKLDLFPDFLNIKSIKHFNKLKWIIALLGLGEYTLTPNDVNNQKLLDKLILRFKFFEIEESK